MKRVLLVLIGLFLSVSVVFSETVPVDKRALFSVKKTGYKYTVLDNGNISLNFDMEGYEIPVLVYSRTSAWEDLELRNISSLAFKAKLDDVDPTIITSMYIWCLMDNNTKKLGAWNIYYESETKIIYFIFNVQIGAEVTGGVMKSALNMAAIAGKQFCIKFDNSVDEEDSKEEVSL